MESLDAGVSAYNWIPSQIVSTYQESQSGKCCLVDRAIRNKAKMEDRMDRGSVSRTAWTSQSGRRENQGKCEAQTHYDTHRWELKYSK